ncbi:MAG: hypothetical protein KF764_29290 [Labilithrix sp.]|nr:hypothetical protein [Labilithrix sp.]
MEELDAREGADEHHVVRWTHGLGTAFACCGDAGGARSPRGLLDGQRIFYANGKDSSRPDGDSRCSAMGIGKVYDFFHGKNVKTVNESFTCSRYSSSLGGEVDGMVQDSHARMHDVSVFKIAGNYHPAQVRAACAYTMNSNCVGGINSKDQVSCFSMWENFNAPIIDRLEEPRRTDREEPDVVALAGDARSGDACAPDKATDFVDVMNIDDPNGWLGDIGTSFAAPAMTALAALLKQACSPSGELNQKWIRAVLRNAGWARNIADFPYSTPSTNLVTGGDWKDGGGALFASAALAFCGIGGDDGPRAAAGNDPGDLSKGKASPPTTGGCSACDDNQDKSLQGPRIAAVGPPNGGNDRREYTKLWEAEFKPGDRIRATIAWDNCPTGKIAPAPVATDLDLFLYLKEGPSSGRYIFSSQSVTDNVEGFDVIIPEGGHYEIYWTYPQGTRGCAALGSDGFEPFSWAINWWQQK